MLLIPVDKAKAGQAVAQDVTDPQGVLLFKAGTALNDDLIGKLKARGVTTLYVEDTGTGEGLNPEEIEKRRKQIDKDTDEMFSEVKSIPLMAALCEAAKKQLKTKIR